MEKFKLKKNNGKNKHSALRAMSFFTTGKKFIKILILAVALVTMIGGFAPRVFATPVTPLDVQFIPDPLFVKPNFLPLDETSGTATVTNNSGQEQTIATEAINILNNDNFGSLLHLKIMENSTVLYDDSLADFFSSGEISLGTISNGTSKIFSYTVSFIDSSDNSYQGKTLGFDVCVGYQGGETHCGNTVIGNENGGGGGGGSSGSTVLIIFNEQAFNITNVAGNGSATITWNTNKLATSQVIYGLSPGPYTLSLTPPNYGYPFSNIEDETKVINHSMLLTGLTPGATYVYRVVSRASPATVSYEHQFTVPIPTQVDADNGLVLGATTKNNTDGRQGDVLGASTEDNGSDISSGNILGASVLPLSGNISSLCSIIALLILLLIYLVWELWLRRRYEKLGIKEAIIKSRFYLFFGGCSLVAIIVCIIIVKYCPIPILLIATIISAGFYAFRRLRIKT